jgi:hypothetical protein
MMLIQTIFTNAVAVAVKAWIGEASSASDEAMVFVKDMSKQVGNGGVGPSILGWLQNPNHPWEAFVSLLEQPW